MPIASYRASSAYTITLASLATSSGLTVGRCATSKSNSSNKDDILGISGQITVGTTTTLGAIEVWAFSQRADSTWPDLFSSAYSGSDGGFTARSREVLSAGAKLVRSITVPAGLTSIPFSFGPRDLAALFDFPVKEHSLFVVHSTGVNLNSTGGNHSIDLSAANY